MLFSKSLFILLVAILGTSWFSDRGTNGLALACGSSSPPPPRQQSPKPVGGGPSIYDIPKQGDGPIKAGLWVGKDYFELPDASYYKLEFKKGEAVSSSLVTNPFRPIKSSIVFTDNKVRFY